MTSILTIEVKFSVTVSSQRVFSMFSTFLLYSNHAFLFVIILQRIQKLKKSEAIFAVVQTVLQMFLLVSLHFLFPSL